MARRIEVIIGPREVWAEFRGWGSRELLTEVNGHPVWSSRRKAWSTSGRAARDAIAAADAKGYAVAVTSLDPEPPATADVVSEPVEGLW